jgi:predicted nucleotidyltransferase
VGDEEFADYVASTLAGLPDVLAVSLGGSRASGTSRPDSDWDFAVYYRGRFDPDDLRGLGWPGEVSAIGGWGGGVFNGGAWLRVEGRPVDVHYRDLDDVEHQIAEAREGRFRIERLMFHLAGIPTYIVAAELALNRVLRGRLPRPEYPDKLRVTASRRWRADARLTLGYARGAHAARGHVADTAGLIATAAAQAAHAVLAGRGEWVTNEKTLLDRAGLRPVDAVLSGLAADPEQLARAVDAAERLLGLSPSAHLLQTWLPGDRYSGPAACGVDRARGRSYRGRRAARDRRGRGRRGTL